MVNAPSTLMKNRGDTIWLEARNELFVKQIIKHWETFIY